MYLFLLGFEAASLSGGGICSGPTCEPLGTSWSSVSATCGSEGGCVTELEEGVAEASRVEGMRRLLAVKLPHLELTVTNKEEEDEEDGCKPEGTGRATRNPLCMCDHLA